MLRYITAFFIDIFGITHPSAKDESRAVWYITLLLLLTLLLIGAIAIVIAHHLQI